MTTRKLSLISLFVALSAVGGIIKIPAIVGSVALDAFPALVAAVLLGGGAGAIVGGLGHLLSALIGGMPLGPFHFMIALEMAILVWAFGKVYLSGKRLFSGLLFFIGNGLILPLPFIYFISLEFYIALVPMLSVAAALNVIIALVVIPRILPIFNRKK